MTDLSAPTDASRSQPPADGVTVVVPVFGGLETLPELVRQVIAVMRAAERSVEIVLVDDSGSDESWSAVRSVTDAHPGVRSIRLARNFGQHNALLCGIRAATMPIVVTVDDDLQHPPAEIPRLLDRLVGDELDLVYGRPRHAANGGIRHAASYLVRWAISHQPDAGVARSVSGFRALRTELRDHFAAASGPAVNLDVLLSWGAARYGEVDVDSAPRTSGRSSYSVRRLMRHAIGMITDFSTWPLQLIGLSGVAGVLVSTVALVVLGVLALAGTTVTSAWVVVATMVWCSSMLLFALGVVAEYVGAVHMRLLRPEPYLVAEVHGEPRADA